jgi:hypothetical protein
LGSYFWQTAAKSQSKQLAIESKEAVSAIGGGLVGYLAWGDCEEWLLRAMQSPVTFDFFLIIPLYFSSFTSRKMLLSSLKG